MGEVIEKKGSMWTTTGVVRNGKLYCLVEEIVYVWILLSCAFNLFFFLIYCMRRSKFTEMLSTVTVITTKMLSTVTVNSASCHYEF